MPTFRLTPSGLGALVGGMVAFVNVGAAVVVVWVAIGALLGAVAGFAVAALERALTAHPVVHRVGVVEGPRGRRPRTSRR